MTIRSVEAGKGVEWLKNAVNLGRHNPKAVFGGVALMLVLLIAAVVVMSLVQSMMISSMGASVSVMLGSSVVMGLVVAVLMAMLIVGLLRLIDAVEHQRPTGAMEVFSGLGDIAALRAIGLLLLLAIVQYALMGLVLVVFAGDVIEWYLAIMQASMAGVPPEPTTALPDGLGLTMVLMTAIGLLMYGVQAIGLCQVALRGRGVFGALADGVVGTFKNLLPLLVLLLVLAVAMVVLMVVVLLLALLIGVLAKIAGMWLAVLLAIPLYLVGMLFGYVIIFGLMYYLWRDVCGDGSQSAGTDDALSA